MSARSPENVLSIVAALAFAVLSVFFMAQNLWNPAAGAAFYNRLLLSVVCFIGALLARELDRGSLLLTLVDKIAKPTSDDVKQLNDVVGAAGFLNRIGLTGVPLAVAVLAVILAALVFLAEWLKYEDAAKAFLNMTTLAVGAFVGAMASSRRRTSESGGQAE